MASFRAASKRGVIFCFKMIEFTPDMRAMTYCADAEPEAVGPPVGVELLHVSIVADDLKDGGGLVADVSELLGGAELYRVNSVGLFAGVARAQIGVETLVSRILEKSLSAFT